MRKLKFSGALKTAIFYVKGLGFSYSFEAGINRMIDKINELEKRVNDLENKNLPPFSNMGDPK